MRGRGGIRILFVFDHVEVGGSQTQALHLGGQLVRAGHAAAVASRGGRLAAEFESAGVPHMAWPAPRHSAPWGVPAAVRAARRVLRDWRPDVIHAHAVLPGLLFSQSARRRLPVVFSPHRSWASEYSGPAGRIRAAAQYALLRARADQVIAVSAGYRREFLRYGIPPERCHLIPNGTDVSAFDVAAPAPDLARLAAAHRLVGTVGRLVEQKRMDVFIDAAAVVARRFADVRFLIVGDGPLRAECERRIAARGLAERVFLLGERRDIPRILAALTVFVMASRWEGVANTLLEALAARRPVAATRVMGLTELLEDGVTGRLVAYGDSVALGEAIIDLLSDPARARELAAAGRRLVESQYDIRESTEALLGVYRQAAAEWLRAPDRNLVE